MAKINIGGKHIYYEVHGEGEALVILNGIMMSTASWTSFIDVFSENNKLILVDFLDQGRSEKMEGEYSQDLHVESLNRLLETLKIEKIHLLGISYGGEVAQRFALRHEDKLLSLILANTTSYTNKYLKDVGEGWMHAARTYDGSKFFKATMPYIYSPEFYEKNIAWLEDREKTFGENTEKEWYEGFIRLVRSAEDLDLREEIGKIHAPTLIMSSEHDATTPERYQEELQRKIKDSKRITIKGSGHASMYEKPYEFASAVIGFIHTVKREIKVL